jgi:hypothetical protein
MHNQQKQVSLNKKNYFKKSKRQKTLHAIPAITAVGFGIIELIMLCPNLKMVYRAEQDTMKKRQKPESRKKLD